MLALWVVVMYGVVCRLCREGPIEYCLGFIMLTVSRYGDLCMVPSFVVGDGDSDGDGEGEGDGCVSMNSKELVEFGESMLDHYHSPSSLMNAELVVTLSTPQA